MTWVRKRIYFIYFFFPQRHLIGWSIFWGGRKTSNFSSPHAGCLFIFWALDLSLLSYGTDKPHSRNECVGFKGIGFLSLRTHRKRCQPAVPQFTEEPLPHYILSLHRLGWWVTEHHLSSSGICQCLAEKKRLSITAVSKLPKARGLHFQKAPKLW